MALISAPRLATLAVLLLGCACGGQTQSDPAAGRAGSAGTGGTPGQAGTAGTAGAPLEECGLPAIQYPTKVDCDPANCWFNPGTCEPLGLVCCHRYCTEGCVNYSPPGPQSTGTPHCAAQTLGCVQPERCAPGGATDDTFKGFCDKTPLGP